METVVLLTDPARPTLDTATVEALRNTWGGGDVVWRAPDEAAEFEVTTVPSNRWDVWAELQQRGIDLCIVPSDRRRKRLLIADMDSTMIGQECIDELADVAGVGDAVKAITARAMNGELDFEAALRERVAQLAGLKEDVIEEVLRTRITEAPGGRTLVGTMKADGAEALLVSGGFTAFSSTVADWIGFDAHQANHLVAREGKLTGEVSYPILGRAAKVEALDAAVARLGLSPADALAVGDGANDLGMLERAGLGVALHAKPAVAAQCDVRVNHGDLTSLLFLQGYNIDAFV